MPQRRISKASASLHTMSKQMAKKERMQHFDPMQVRNICVIRRQMTPPPLCGTHRFYGSSFVRMCENIFPPAAMLLQLLFSCVASCCRCHSRHLCAPSIAGQLLSLTQKSINSALSIGSRGRQLANNEQNPFLKHHLEGTAKP